MRKVAFALAHCFQTCLMSLACCSMCLILCLLTKIALKNLSNRSKITLKLLAVCKTGLHFRATSFGLARKHSVSREIISILCEIKLWCQISRELETFSHGLKSVSCEVKLPRAAWKGFSREILCQHYLFLICFSCLRPERYLFGIRYCSLSANKS